MTRGGKRHGAGRPKGSGLPPEIQKRAVAVRFSDQQLARIKEAAKREGQPYTVFIREAALRAANNLLDNL